MGGGTRPPAPCENADKNGRKGNGKFFHRRYHAFPAEIVKVPVNLPWNNYSNHCILSQTRRRGIQMARPVIRFIAKLSTSLLGAAGVLTSGCNHAAEPTYGVPSLNVTITGTVLSSADSSAIEGIRVGAFSPGDSLSVGDRTFTDADGNYYLCVEDYGFFDTDSIGIAARDVDGAENGNFFGADTVLALPPGDEPELDADMMLQPRWGN